MLLFTLLSATAIVTQADVVVVRQRAATIGGYRV